MNSGSSEHQSKSTVRFDKEAIACFLGGSEDERERTKSVRGVDCNTKLEGTLSIGRDGSVTLQAPHLQLLPQQLVRNDAHVSNTKARCKQCKPCPQVALRRITLAATVGLPLVAMAMVCSLTTK